MSFQWKVRVYYEDTDAGGVVYHARYLAFYERARTEMLRHCAIEQQSLLLDNLAFVVAKLNINYLLPAKLDDELTIVSKITQLKAASLVFEQQMFNQHEQCVARAEVCVAMVDLSKMKPIRVPHTILSRFKLWMD